LTSIATNRHLYFARDRRDQRRQRNDLLKDLDRESPARNIRAEQETRTFALGETDHLNAIMRSAGPGYGIPGLGSIRCAYLRWAERKGMNPGARRVAGGKEAGSDATIQSPASMLTVC